MSNLGDTVIKFLGEKIKQRYVVEAHDLFELFLNMGIIEDQDLLNMVLEHLESRNIDVNFRDNQSDLYEKYKRIERVYKFMKTTNINKEKVLTMMNKVDTIKPKLDTSWMEQYRAQNDEEPESEELKTATPIEINPDLANLQQRIVEESTNRIISELNQMSDEQRFEHAMNRINELQNIINNNQ